MPPRQIFTLDESTDVQHSSDRTQAASMRHLVVDGLSRGERAHIAEPRPIATSTVRQMSLRDIRRPDVKPVHRTISDRTVKPALPRQNPSVVLHRGGFGPKLARKPTPKPRRPRTRHAYALRALVVIILLCGGGVAANAWQINRIAETQASVLAKTSANGDSDSVPSEEAPSAEIKASYQVAPDMPRILSIPRINVNARIQKLGVKADNDLRAPTNIFDVGWYEGSAKPGEKGTILLDGHVTGLSKHGVFYSLANVREGDEITLEQGDGTIHVYRVVKQETYDYDKVSMSQLLVSIEPGKPGLNIVTNSTRFDVKANRFERRVVVFAILK